ncbi:MAG: UbiX family flavin prenyltransferase [Planctomycetes bacterium]|nr:UbiX family flavin prenyltransferase [Planctomycetota bacterium]MCP4861247.1 UbiX family flavin prenyltransferase [Planctomycetota bacterium]
MSKAKQVTKVVLGVSGASGACYAVRTLQLLLAAGIQVDLIYSNAAKRVLFEEMDIRLQQDPTILLQGQEAGAELRLWPNEDIGAPPASGTAIGDVVMLVPCSLSTIGAIAHGGASNLIERAAQVALKEGKHLLVVPRESPLSKVHLDCLSRLAWAGATVLPASPGFYQRPQSIEDLVDQVCGKILNRCGIEQQCLPAWDGGIGAQRHPVGEDQVDGRGDATS